MYICMYVHCTCMYLFIYLCINYKLIINLVIDDAVVSPVTQLVNPFVPSSINITCTVPSHPLVEITWIDAISGNSIDVNQLPVGFRGPSVSQLNLNTSDLNGTHLFNCTAELSQYVTTATARVNAYSKLS